MNAAYVDTSFLLAILLGEPAAAAHRRLLRRFDRLFSSDLIVAEALCALAREGVDLDAASASLAGISLVLPSRSLAPEIRETLGAERLRGADLWHLSCASFLAGTDRGSLTFLTRDVAQRRAAARLGFPTP